MRSARRPVTRVSRAAGAALAAILLPVSMVGCQAIGYFATTLEETKDVRIEAQYDGLQGKRVAVLVDAPMDIMYEYPGLYEELTTLITYNLPRFVNGVDGEPANLAEMDPDAPRTEVVPSNHILAYQNSNIYWATMDYAKLAEELGADRLVLIDLVDYRLHAAGNSYLWDGLLRADVHVVEADSFDPSSFAFSTGVVARFPPVEGVSRGEATPAAIHAGLRLTFVQKVVRLFHDHIRNNADLIEEERRG